MKFKLFLTTTLISFSAFSAALCPPYSCNPHNGCTQGCNPKNAYGQAACDSENPKAAEAQAIQNGVKAAFDSCSRSFFYNTGWVVKTYDNGSSCQVRASATVSCYQ